MQSATVKSSDDLRQLSRDRVRVMKPRLEAARAFDRYVSDILTLVILLQYTTLTMQEPMHKTYEIYRISLNQLGDSLEYRPSGAIG